MASKLKSVIIVGAGIMQIPAIRTAKSLGLNVIASDRNPEAEGFAYCDVPLVLDTKDAAGHVKFALANREEYNIVGAFAGADVAVTVAHITSALGLPGIPLDVAVRSNNKHLMKERWLKDGVPTPMSVHVRSIEEAKAAVEKVGGYPLMIKAIDSAASRGTRKISRPGDLGDALEAATKVSTTGTALIEEFVEGPEQSVETIVYGGKHYHCGIADRHFGFDPFPIETGHTNPTRLPEETQEEIYQVVDRAADSLGITFGPAKADMIMTKKGPMILEMPARLSGGFHSQYTTPLALGMDPIRAVLRLAIGEPIPEEDVTGRFSRVSVCKAVFPPPGKVMRITGLAETKKIKGVEQVFLLVREGDIIPDYRNCANRICYIITSGNTYADADAAFENAKAALMIETAPV